MSQLLSIVANCMRKAYLTNNGDISQFCLKKIKYLGFLIGDGCIKIDRDKISADFSVPTYSLVFRNGWLVPPIYQKFLGRVSASENFNRLPNLNFTDDLVFKRFRFREQSDSPIGEAGHWRLRISYELITNLIFQAHDPLLSAHGCFNEALDRLKNDVIE